MFKGQRIDKKVTKTCSNTRDPVYDELFEFNLVNLLNQFSTGIQNEYSNEVITQVLSKIQIFFLVMDYDQIEKSDAIGKIDLLNQSYQQRLLILQKSVEFNHSEQSIQSSSQNWYNIFYQPDMPILGLYQLKGL